METNDSIQRRIKCNQMQRNVRRSQLQVRRFFALLRFALIMLIILFTYQLVKCPKWYVNKDVFKTPQNEYLRIYGNEITPDYKILTALRKTKLPNHPIYMISTDKMAKQIMEIEPVKRVFVRRYWWPARFAIMVEERKPILLISPSEKIPPVAFFAEGGKLIGREYLPLKKKKNTLTVLTCGTHGDDYHKWNENKVKSIDKLGKTLTSLSGETVKYIDMRNPHDIFVQLQTVKLRIGELDSTSAKRIAALPSILPQIKSFPQPIKYIDLRWEESPVLKLNDSKKTKPN